MTLKAPLSAAEASYRAGQRARELMAAPGYWRDRAMQQEVRALFVQHYGEQPIQAATGPGEEPPPGIRGG
jgi:hypothetical protein